ncbi:hypothetical protein K435DRAFT_968728 [Dendrothele bispora CBS 962.96]|uniref:Uncharacterized protein n=1 Tax=Dendrothele bispora (strain CBS 962.96) TaxID=1314807 RepID=A0A4S8LM57_DENBC|nr:hypothetical protein K435DRAFT_968728 [Dendrothele bispora CBS 962.96]
MARKALRVVEEEAFFACWVWLVCQYSPLLFVPQQPLRSLCPRALQTPNQARKLAIQDVFLSNDSNGSHAAHHTTYSVQPQAHDVYWRHGSHRVSAHSRTTGGRVGSPSTIPSSPISVHPRSSSAIFEWDMEPLASISTSYPSSLSFFSSDGSNCYVYNKPLTPSPTQLLSPLQGRLKREYGIFMHK